MDIKLKIFRVLLLSILALSVFQAGAVSFYTEYTADRRSPAGTTWVKMLPISGYFCFLSKVGMEEIDVSSEYAHCNISYIYDYTNYAYYWWLSAYVEGGSDAFVSCKATCYRN